MRTLFLQAPSYEGFDGGAGSRYQARREIQSFWYPTWLAQPAALVENSKLIDAPPHKIGLDAVVRSSDLSSPADLARVLATRGAFLADRARAAEAVPLFREALAIRRKALPSGHPDRAVSASLLGDALRRLGRLDEAEPLLVRSHAALIRQPEPDSAKIADAALRLADLEAARGRADGSGRRPSR